MGMDEVASFSIDAKVVFSEVFTLFCFVLHVSLLVFEKLVRSMSKFASHLVRAIPVFHKTSAKF